MELLLLLLVLLVLHPKRRLHPADKIRSLEELHASLPAVLDVPKGVDVPILIHALQEIRGTALLSSLLLPPKAFDRIVCGIHGCDSCSGMGVGLFHFRN